MILVFRDIGSWFLFFFFSMVPFFFSPVTEKLNVRKADCFQGVVIFLQEHVWGSGC